MALVPDQKFSTFQNGGDLVVGDIIVGLRDGLNTRFDYTGELPPGVIVPITQGGTGATTASAARTNLGLGSMAVQAASAVAITGGTLAGVAITASTAALTAGSVVAAPSAGTDITNKTYVDSLVGGAVASVSGTLNRITSTGGVNPVIDISASYVGQSSITTLGTIATGVWQGTVVGSTYGGTGVNNGSSTLTMGGSHVLSGAFASTFTFTGVTGVTFPTSGTLATTAQLPTPAALTKTDDTNVTLTLGGTPATALLQATSLTLGWTGTLSGTRGGTGVNNGASTITLGGSLTTSGAFASTFTMTNTTAVTFPTSGTLATTAQIPTGAALTKTDDTNVTLSLGGSPTTALVNAASLTLGWTGTLSGTRGGTGVNNGASTITLGGSLTTSGAFASTFTMTGVTGVTFPTSGTLATTAQLPTPAALTKTDDTNVTLTLGGTPTTALLQATSLTLGWTGQLAVSRGGTGISSFGTGVATALGQNVTGSGGIVLATSPTMVTPVLGAASATSLSFSSTSGIIGTTTNDSAAAGSVGEIISSVIAAASATSLTTSTPKNVTSLALTAGDWDIWGNVGFSGNAATTFTAGVGWINSASASVPDGSLYAQVIYSPAITVFTVGNVNFTVPGYRVSLSGSATYYLSVSAIFGVNSCSAYGGIYARRRR